MAEVTEGRNFRYVRLTDERMRDFVRPRVERFADFAVRAIRDEIVAIINASEPAGRLYRLPGASPPFWDDGERIPGKWYRASAPGQPPAIRTARYVNSWVTRGPVWTGDHLTAGVTNTARVGDRDQYALWAILELGRSGGGAMTFKMRPRPHIEKGFEAAKPLIWAQAKKLGS